MSSGKDRGKHDGRKDDTGRAGAGQRFDPDHPVEGSETIREVRSPREPDETFGAEPKQRDER